MPSRTACVAILLFWAYAAGGLLRRDVLPEFWTTPPPALRTIALLNWTKRLPYEPRGMIQNGMGPIDRLPGLQVGQRWETQVVSPLTGRVERVNVEVAGKRVIQWDNNVVTTLEVVTHFAP